MKENIRIIFEFYIFRTDLTVQSLSQQPGSYDHNFPIYMHELFGFPPLIVELKIKRD